MRRYRFVLTWYCLLTVAFVLPQSVRRGHNLLAMRRSSSISSESRALIQSLKRDTLGQCFGYRSLACEVVHEVHEGAADGSALLILPLGANTGFACLMVKARMRFPKCVPNFALSRNHVIPSG
jgi:hypothetical protein